MKDAYKALCLIPPMKATPIRIRRRAVMVPPSLHQRYFDTKIEYQEDSFEDRNNNENTKIQSLSDMANIGEVCSLITIQVCTSSTCSNKRRALGHDDGFLITDFYEKVNNVGAHGITIEESNCLGQCKKGPCVSVNHEDYEGSVALEGMTPMEFNRKW